MTTRYFHVDLSAGLYCAEAIFRSVSNIFVGIYCPAAARYVLDGLFHKK